MFNVIVILLLHFVGFSYGKQNGTCTKGWYRWKDSCYYFSKQSKTWYEALNHCKTFDKTSFVTDVLSKEENDYLENQIQERAYVGCFTDATDRLLDSDFMENKAGMTNRLCIDYCRRKGYRYAGTQFSQQCFCGMNTHKYNETDISECETMCPGNQSERCGGHWKLSVYRMDSARYWLGGICITKNTDRQWFESRKPVTGYVNWETSPNSCNGTTCMDMGPAINTPSYKWTANGCLKEKRFICKSSVKNQTSSHLKHQSVCVTTCERMPHGHYQSCARCDGYISCTGDRMYFQFCPMGLLWDDFVKDCRYTSTTCDHFTNSIVGMVHIRN